MRRYEVPTGAETRLIGELIGLARGTDGSEHLITTEAADIVAACLRARGSDALMDSLREKVIEVKRHIIPDCFTCANPCGRTFPFNLSRLLDEPEEIRRDKLMLLTAAKEMAELARNPEQDRLLFQALIAIGIEEIDPYAMKNLLNEIKAFVSSDS